MVDDLPMNDTSAEANPSGDHAVVHDHDHNHDVVMFARITDTFFQNYTKLCLTNTSLVMYIKGLCKGHENSYIFMVTDVLPLFAPKICLCL